MKRKYLDDARVFDRWDTWDIGEDRIKKYKKIAKKTGVDPRELWNLDHTFYCWLYERLVAYREVAVKTIDFEADGKKFTFEGDNYNQLQMIDMILERLNFFFSEKYYMYDPESQKKIKEIGLLWTEVLPAMWT